MELFEALGLDIKILIAQLVNFAVLFFVLYKFGYKPIFDFMESRKEGIKKGLSDAKEAETKLTEMTEKEKEVLHDAKKESQRLISEAEELAIKNKDEIIAAAHKEGEGIVLAARKKTEEDKGQMLREVKAEVSQLVVAATEKVLGQKVDSEVDKLLIQDAIKQVDN